MTILSWGWQGTIDEAQWAKMASLLGNAYAVDGPTALAPTAVAGQRKVNVAIGTAFGKGIAAQVTAAEQPTIPTPAAGQWFLLVLRRVWASKTATLTTLASTTTTTAVPAANTAPLTYPGSMTQSPGATDDMPVAWVWANVNDTTLVVVSLLKETADVRIGQLAAMLPPIVADAAARLVRFPNPVQGDRVYNSATQAEEVYLGLYNATTNPAGATPAGWYPVSGNLPLGVMNRGGTGSTIPDNVYSDLSPNVHWTAAQMIGGMTYNNGFVIPVTGVYRLSAAVHVTTSSGLLSGFFTGAVPSTVSQFKGAAVGGTLQSNSVATPQYVQKFAANDVVKLAGLNAGGVGNWPALGLSNFACEYIGAPR